MEATRIARHVQRFAPEEGEAPRLTVSKHGRKGRSYRIDGEPIQSVTKIIDEGVPKPALRRWHADQVAHCVVTRRRVVMSEMTDEEIFDFLRGAPFRARDAAANRGTEVHDLAARLLRGEPVRPPPEIEPHVELYADFLDSWGIGDALVERPCFNLEYRYGGTFDLLASSTRIAGRNLFDVKTSGSGVYGEIALQLGGYSRAEVYVTEDGEVAPMERVDGCYAVWVTPQGYDVFPVEVTEEEWLTFRAAARMAWWRQHRMDRVVGDSMWSGQVVPATAATEAS